VRKLWTARALLVLAAVGLSAVVVDECREQGADDQAVMRIGDERSRASPMTLHLHWSAEPRRR
jgi:hypothetical protein